MRSRAGQLGIGVLGAACAASLAIAASRVDVAAAENTGFISGVVTSSKGPEAGVWVIAETKDFPAKLRKIVVTDDQGRFVLPELPAARFDLWVRGYGLTDSKPTAAKSGQQNVKLAAVLARTPQEAAQSYPSNYWLSLINLPAASEFPGTGPKGNGIGPGMTDQSEWINNLKGCTRCHQVGSKPTRIIPDLDKFPSAEAAWDHRVQRGQRGALMSSFMTGFGRERGLKMFAEWTTAIKNGAVPETAPPRPSGIERNIVITMWNWGDNVAFVHDEIATDKRNPRVNPNGLVYGVDIGNDNLLITDPVNPWSEMLRLPTRADRSTIPVFFTAGPFNPYRNFGEKVIWDDPANPHNPMMDANGRVWMTSTIRGRENPAYCGGAGNKFGEYFPVQGSTRQASFYNPKTKEFTLIDTCFSTHHLQFAEDDSNTLYFSGDRQVFGWIDTKKFDASKDEQASQGWCPAVLDTNGDGKITKPWNEPATGRGANAKPAMFDPARDTRVPIGTYSYGVVANPVDDSLWGVTDDYPGELFRFDKGSNPPQTCITERYTVPKELGYRTRGIDVDRKGVIWMALASSSQLASFDRTKCQTLNGPATRDGLHCKEGWTFYPVPGPTFKGTTIGTDFHYYNWVDQFNTLGLGENVPIVNGSNSDSLIAFLPDKKQWVMMRVPFPMAFHSRGMDGRIDNPNAGWKGRGLYATYGADAAWHIEGGPVEPGNLVRFQIRPDPLAR